MRSLVAKPKRERVQRAKVVKRTLWCDFFQFSDRESAAIGGADQCADAGSGDEANGDTRFFQNFENSDVCDAASESAAQSKTDGRSGSGLRNSSGKVRG